MCERARHARLFDALRDYEDAVALKRLKSTARFAALAASCAGLIIGGCGGTYDDCHASKTCPSGGASGSSGQGSGGASGQGAVGGSALGAGESGDGGIPTGVGGGAGSAAQSGGGGLDAGQGGEAGGGGEHDAGGASGSAGTGETGGEGGTEAEPLPDTQPPHVVEVSPEDAATGVRADADIVVTFSEPMNRVETEKAYSSLDLPTKNVIFSWSNGDRRLTIHPNNGLEYGEWTAGSATNHDQVYSYLIENTARDKAGNLLGGDLEFAFTMLREYSEQLTMVSASVVPGGPVSASCTLTPTLSLGDIATQDGRGLLATFSTAGTDWLDDGLDSFRVDLTFDTTVVTSFLGPLHVDRVREDPATATWATPVLEQLSLTQAGSSWTADAREGLLTDVAERTDDRTQYFIHHELQTNNDGTAQVTQLTCSSLKLRVSYLGL
jgi:hypothetical protein